MMKRIMSLLLAFLMVLSIMPMSIFAEGIDEVIPPEVMPSSDEAQCSCPENYDSSNGHAATCPLYTCPECGGAPWHETCPEPEEQTPDYSGDVGKFAVLNSALDTYTYTYDNGRNLLTFIPEDFTNDAVFIITGWRWDAEKKQLWYKAEFYSGGPQGDFGEWSSDHEMLQNDKRGDAFIFVAPCGICGKPNCTTEHVKCELCGGYDCTKIHFYCEHCESYTCTEAHLICPACGTLDCETAHSWCGICSAYDCGIEHVNKYKPITAPVIPANPTLTPGQIVSIADGLGNSVGAAGITLYAGEQTSLSAWCDLSGAYQWQIRYDAANDLWADIQGQTGKGILVTPAMVASVIKLSGSAAIRCVVTDGENSYASAAIPVNVGARAQAASEEPESGASASAGSEGELQTVYVVVTYEYSDGRTAASSDFAQLVPGKAYSHSYPLPTIPGYMATLETNSLGAYVEIQGDNLVMNIPENVLTEAYTVFTIKYVPDFVNYTVIHYWQNVDNDYYAEHERENIDDKYKTGEQVAEAHKSYPGLYNLLYETPTAAADGSTVVEVYYDRYYYLMKFELGDMGYGVDPVYARYGDVLEIATPTRPGYTFRGWSLDGVTEVELPATVPAENRTYIALWTPGDPVDYTIVYWKENADDTNYSYWTQVTLKATPGEVISGNDSVARHVTDEQYFTYNDILTDKDVEIKGNGSTIINVYYNRNYYTIYFKGYGKCAMDAHRHGTNCVSELICHIHNSECVRELTCLIQEHVHDDCVPQCGLPIHKDHGDACTICEKELHPAHTVDGNCYVLDCDHTHTLQCYGNPRSANFNNDNYENALDDMGENEPQNGYVYGFKQGRNGQVTYYLRIGNQWRQGGNVSRGSSLIGEGTHTTGNGNNRTTYYAYKYQAICSHSHSIEGGCYDLTCTKPIHASHSEAEGCYSDVIHTGHTDECYDHASHVHTDSCYIYQCNETDHEHDESCYRECYLPAHSHNNDCNRNDSDNVIYVITAKYEQNVADIWPTYERLKTLKEPYKNDSGDVVNNNGYKFRGWDIDNASNEAVSKRVTMTPDLCDTDSGEQNAEAKYSADYFYKLYYMFESFDQTSGPDGNERRYYDSETPNVAGKYYDSSPDYYQELYYSSDTTFGQKQISGMTAVGTQYEAHGDDDDDDYVIYNFLYYTRDRSDLRFHNVNEVEKTVTDIMFEQPLANFTDANGNLLRDYEPPYPEGLEPGAYQFVDWYTTPECFDGTEVDFSKLTMPDNDLTLYAKWEPVSYTVKYYLSEESMAQGETIPQEMARLVEEALENGTIDEAPANDPYSHTFANDTVKHGAYIEELSDPGVSAGYREIHPRAGYEFVGWFYVNEDGEETAFDPNNMPVHQDLELYGKWSANKICRYNVHFALDRNNDGQPDTDADGNIIYIADSLTGSGIAGHTYTFTAKGSDELYEDYDEGYFPTVGSHSINIDIADEEGTDANSYTFLYKEKTVAPYTVYYKNKATGEDLIDPKVVAENKNIIVTENFVAIPKYMPDEYQQTLVITADGKNEITFWYTKDELHALYVVNYYIQNLNSDLTHSGWTKYTSLQNTGIIGTDYTAEAITIDGFTLSPSYTDTYNTVNKINGMNNTALPSSVGAMSNGSITGTLGQNGMELNFYYTRNLYPYEFRFMLNGTTTVLADPEFGKAAYDGTVIEAAKEIVADLDGDGINEDYRLYDPTETTKSIHINKDGEALDNDDVVTAGQAKVNVATFYYIRCTQTMTVTKVVEDLGVYSDPDPDKQFTISLLIHAKEGYHQSSYPCRLSDGTSGILYPAPSAPNTLQFTLKAGQTITIEGLPTAEYSISELNLPESYYIDKYEPAQKNKLTVDSQLDIRVINTYDPATLEISKTVDVVENDNNIPEVKDFFFTVTVPAGVTGKYVYIVGGATRTAEVDNGKMVISLKNGEAARFVDLPRGVYTVEEDNYSAYGYNSYVSLNGADYIESRIMATELARSDDDSVNFKNMYPVGDLWIEKTVSKEFYGTVWTGDSFTFTVERTTEGRPLIAGNTYDIYEGSTKRGTATVDADRKLQLEIVFDADDAAELDEAEEQGNEVIRTYVVKNVPAGEYSVTEASDADYNQSDLTVSGLVIPAETAPVAKFANELIRPDGSLYLEKELVPAEGFNPSELPTDTVFSFTVELTELPPQGTKEITVSKNPGTTKEEISQKNMVDGKFTIELMAGENVIIDGLPIGSYRITEATIPYYANSFAHKVNGSWEAQAATAFDDGRLYTDITVLKDERSDVKCTNIYPVDTAELVIQKLVTKAYGRDTLPEDTFIFTVTLEEDDRDSYSYNIYNQDGSPALKDGTAEVINKTFSIPLTNGQYAVVEKMPVCGYTISENASAADYSGSYKVYLSECESAPSKAVDTTGELSASGEGFSFSRTFSAGKVETVVFTNEYRRHLGTLTITKTASGGNVDDTFVFHIKGADPDNSYIDMDVTIDGSGSVTIYEMPLGSYTVTEDSSWSWRWICSSNLYGTEVISVEDLHAEIAFNNSFDENRWLNGTDCEMNVFSKKEND